VNSLLDRDIIQGAADAAHGKRPAETDVARITWLIGSSFMNHIHDNGLFSTANPINMDANDYRGQYGGDVLRDCSVQSGKNFFAYYDEASGQDSLFYDDPNSAAYDSGCTLSNVLADIDNVTTFGLLDDWELVRDPSKVYAGAYLPYSGGSTYRYSAAVAAAFYTRDGTAPNANISTLTAANAAADRFIADSATEDDRLTGRVKIPAAHVNDIYAGMLVTFKASHMPGYETGRKCRVIIRSVAQDEESDQFYNVHFELSPVNLPPAAAWVFYYDVNLATAQAVWASDDNVTWHEVIDHATLYAGTVNPPGALPGTYKGLAAIPPAEARHRYWQIRWANTQPAGYFIGVDINYFRVLQADMSTDLLGLLPGGVDWWNPLIGGGGRPVYGANRLTWTASVTVSEPYTTGYPPLYGYLNNVNEYPPGGTTWTGGASAGTMVGDQTEGYGLNTGVIAPNPSVIVATWSFDVGYE